jgi:hypothetical protein
MVVILDSKMSELAEALIYLSIASLAVAPAVFPLVLGSIGPLLARQKYIRSELAAEAVAIFSSTGKPARPRGDLEALDAIDKHVKTTKAKQRSYSRKTRDYSIRWALLFPMSCWAVSLTLASIQRFSGLRNIGIESYLNTGAIVFLVAGYVQVLRTLAAVYDLHIDSAANLELETSDPFLQDPGQPGSRQGTIQINMVVRNVSLKVASNVQFEVEVPKQGLIFPAEKPKQITRMGREVSIIYTSVFPALKTLDSFIYFLIIIPAQPGEHLLRIRATSNEGATDSHSVIVRALGNASSLRSS